MAIGKLRVIIRFAVTLILILCSPDTSNSTEKSDSTLTGQIYQLTVRSKQYVEADLIDSALISAYLADSLAKSSGAPDDTTLAAVYNNLAYCHFRNEDGEAALAYLDSALAVLQKGEHEQDSVFADIYVNYGRIYDRWDRYDEAIESYEKALRIQQVALGPDHIEVGTICNNLAIVKMYTGQYDEAEQLFIRTLEIWKNALGPEHPDVGLCLFNLGYLYDDLGRYEDAERCYYQSLAIRQKALGPDHSSIGVIYVNIADLQISLGKEDSAFTSLSMARDIIGKSLGERSIFYAQVLGSLGSMIVSTRGKYAEAESLYKEALSICEETLGPEHGFAASLYTHLADLSSLFGKDSLALEYHKKAADITARVFGNNSINYALEIARLAGTYSYLIAYSDVPISKIDSLYTEYRSIISECGTSNVEYYHRSMRTFGAALYNAGMYEESARLLKRYISDEEQYRGTITVRGEVALLSLMMGHRREALEAAEEFTVLLADTDNLAWNDRAYCHSTLAEIYLFAGLVEKAIEHTEKTRYYQDLFLKTAFSNASQATKITLLNRSTFVSYLPTRLDEINTPQARSLALEIEMMAKSYVIDAISHEHEFIQCSDDPFLRSICDEYSNVSSRTASLVRAGMVNSEPGASQDLINSLVRERDSLESIISNLCGARDPSPSNLDFEAKDVARCLNADDVLIEYIRFLSTDSIVAESILRRNGKTNYGAFVMDRSGKIDFYDLGPAAIIDSLISKSREHINNTGTKALTDLGSAIEKQLSDINRAIYAKIVSPFASTIENKKRLIIAPERNLYLIPFDILPVEQDRYLIEKYEVSYVSSGLDLLEDKNMPSTLDGPIVVFADPDYNCDLHSNYQPADSTTPMPQPPDLRDIEGSFRGSDNCLLTGFESLPYTAEETQSIKSLVGQYSDKQILIYTGDMAREKTLASMETQPSALHFATHGFICIPNHAGSKYISPMFQSGLALAGANTEPPPHPEEFSGSYEDGILSAYEVSALNLIGTDLVVLSACESGVGEYVNGMGVMGLRSSFRQAGAKSVIMSLWKVPDDMSAKIMQGFYKRWLTGESKIDALRNTSLELLDNARQQYGNSHPIHWSGFILSGKSR